jgi:GNAT superfamily N-acetyltransferase
VNPRPAGQTSALRNATESDVPVVLQLVRELAAYEGLLDEVVVTEDDLRQALFGPERRVYALLAEIDGESVGLALWCYTFTTFRGQPILFLEDLFVKPSWRGCGIGLALLRSLAQRAIAEKCHRMEWRVLNWNAPSIAFYERIGAVRMDDWHVRRLGGDALTALASGAQHG